MTQLDRLALLKQRRQTEQQNDGDNNGPRFFKHWNIPFGGSCTLRYLPDAGDPTGYFFRKKLVFNWKFTSADEPGVTYGLRTASNHMYKEKSCEVYNYLGSQFNAIKKKPNEELRQKLNTLWVKTSYLYSGFVRDPGHEESNKPENPIRWFDMNKGMHKIIEAPLYEQNEDRKLASKDPVDFEQGLTYIIKKTKNQFDAADYSTSGWSNRCTPLSDTELEAIEKHGLINLGNLLPAQLDTSQQEVQMVIFEAAFEGKPWNPDWETAGFKPFKYSKDGKTETEDASSEEEVETTSAAASSASNEERRAKVASVFDKIKSRQT